MFVRSDTNYRERNVVHVFENDWGFSKGLAFSDVKEKSLFPAICFQNGIVRVKECSYLEGGPPHLQMAIQSYQKHIIRVVLSQVHTFFVRFHSFEFLDNFFQNLMKP